MTSQLSRWIPVGGALLLALRLAACSSGVGAKTAPEGLAGSAGASDSSANGGQSPDPTNTGKSCSPLSQYCETGRHCSGDTVVSERVACVVTGVIGTPGTSGQCADGPAETVMTPCAEGQRCSAGLCLTHAAAPAKACASASDCGLPPSTCAERNLVIFTDPSCDAGQCRWREIIESCGGASSGCDVASGQCAFPPKMMTAAGEPPDPMPDREQPAAAPEQVCAQASDCVAPAATCYRASTVNYVNPACEAGLCVFGLDIVECAYPAHACQDGLCQ